MGNAAARSGDDIGMNKHAAVQCGVLNETMPDASSWTAAQAASMAAAHGHSVCLTSSLTVADPLDTGLFDHG